MLVRTRPFHPVFDQPVDRVFDQLSRSFLTTSRRTPTIDASWTDGSLVLTTDLPGTPAEAVDISVAGRTLTIAVNSEQMTWERSLRLGAALDAEQVSARYLDGRLTVTIAPGADRRAAAHRGLGRGARPLSRTTESDAQAGERRPATKA